MGCALKAHRELLLSVCLLAAACRPGAPASLPAAPTTSGLESGATASPTGASPDPPTLIQPVSTPGPTQDPTPTTAEPPDPNPAAPALPARIEPANASRLAVLQAREHGPWELVLALAWSPRGDIMAAAAGQQVYFYGGPEWSLQGKISLDGWPARIAYHPDGSWLAVAERGGNVAIYNLDEGEMVRRWEAHRKGANQVVFSPDGARLASSGNDGYARLWSFPDGILLTEIIGGAYAVPDLVFAGPDASLALANSDLVRFRETAGGRITHTIYAATGLYSLAYGAGSQRLAAGTTDNRLYLWDLAPYLAGESESRRPLLELAGHTGRAGSAAALVWTVNFNPEETLLVSGGGDGRLRVWDSQTGDLLADLDGHGGAVTEAAFDPGGRYLASGGLDGRILIHAVSP